MTIRSLAVGAVLTVALASRLAADCGPPSPTCEARAKATVVFYGEVLQSTFYPNSFGPNEASTDGRQEVTFNVLEAFKGAKKGLFTSTLSITSEAVSFRQGRRYLVYAAQHEGRWVTECSRTREMSKPTEWSFVGELAELRTCGDAARRAR